MAKRRFRLDRLHVYHAPFAMMAARMSPGPEHVTHAWIEDEPGLQALDAVSRADGYDNRPRQMRKLLESGTRICAGFEDGAPIGWCLFQPVCQTSYQWLHIHGGPEWVFGIGEYVRRDRRGLRVGPGVVRYASQVLLDEGYTTSGSVVAMGNRAAIRSHEFNGGERIGWICGLRVASGHAVVGSDGGVRVGRFDAKRPCVYTCQV